MNKENENEIQILKIHLQMQIIQNNHKILKNQNNKLLKQIKILQNEKTKKTFIELDKEKNYKNNLIQILLINSYNSLHHLNRPKNDNHTQFLNRLYKWIIDEEFDLTIIQECNYSDIINDLKQHQLHDPLYGNIFWDCFKTNIKNYLKYGTTNNITNYLKYGTKNIYF